MERNKPSFYGILPASVRYDKTLKPMARVLFADITALSNAKGYCNATNKTLGDWHEVSFTTVSRWISNLKKSGHIRIVEIKEGRNVVERKIYPVASIDPIDKKINTLLTKRSIPYCQKDQYPIDENAKENNTSINNTSINNMDTPSKNLCILYIQEKVQDEDIDIEQFSIDLAEDFVDYYESVGWTIGKGRKMKSWRHAMNRWIKQQLKKQKNGSNKFGSTTKAAAAEALANLNREEF